MDILVTSAAGYIGSVVTEELVKEVHDLYLFLPIAGVARAYIVPEGLDWDIGIDHLVLAVYMYV